MPQTIFANDQSMMTSVIGVLFLGSAAYLGREGWLVEEQRTEDGGPIGDPSFVLRSPSFDYSHLAERLCVMAGFVGTAIGLSLQAKALAGGATSFTALATSLFTTAAGGTAAAVIAIRPSTLRLGSGGRGGDSRTIYFAFSFFSWRAACRESSSRLAGVCSLHDNF